MLFSKLAICVGIWKNPQILWIVILKVSAPDPLAVLASKLEKMFAFMQMTPDSTHPQQAAAWLFFLYQSLKILDVEKNLDFIPP